MKLYVGNLDFEANEDAVRRLFQPFDSVETVEIATDWETGHSRGFAFVRMTDESEAQKAIARLDGEELDGRSLAVREAPPEIPSGFDSLAI